MVSNARVRLTIVIVFVVLTIASLRVAVLHNFWREFVITEILLVVASLSCAFLLHDSTPRDSTPKE